jgi:xanthine dehydrogenase accessory factor
MSNDVLEVLRRLLESNEPVCHVAVLQQAGSTPRTAGARMLVSGEGAIHGTIGGGRVEAEAIRLAREALRDEAPRTARFDLAAGADMDMVCGGDLELLVEPLRSAGLLELLVESAGLLAAGQAHWLLTELDETAGALRIARRLVTSGVEMDRLGIRQADWALVEAGEPGQRILVELREPPHVLHLFGAGHVAHSTARVGALAGFRVVVCDDRPEFASAGRYPDADRIVVLESFADVVTELGEPLDERACVVIVTRGHRHDEEVLDQILRTRAGYIGMIGSRTKREGTYRNLRRQGFTDADLARVHSPVGLDIGAQTPEEIGVAIVAELIAHRAGRPTLEGARG